MNDEEKQKVFLQAVKCGDTQCVSVFLKERAERLWIPRSAVLRDAFVVAAEFQQAEVCQMLSNIQSRPLHSIIYLYKESPKVAAFSVLVRANNRSAVDMHLKYNFPFQEKYKLIRLKLEEINFSGYLPKFSESVEDTGFLLMLYADMMFDHQIDQTRENMNDLQDYFKKKGKWFLAPLHDSAFEPCYSRDAEPVPGFLKNFLKKITYLEEICDEEDVVQDLTEVLISEKTQHFLRSGEREFICRLAVIVSISHQKFLQKSFKKLESMLVQNNETEENKSQMLSYHPFSEFQVEKLLPFSEQAICDLIEKERISELEFALREKKLNVTQKLSTNETLLAYAVRCVKSKSVFLFLTYSASKNDLSVNILNELFVKALRSEQAEKENAQKICKFLVSGITASHFSNIRDPEWMRVYLACEYFFPPKENLSEEDLSFLRELFQLNAKTPKRMVLSALYDFLHAELNQWNGEERDNFVHAGQDRRPKPSSSCCSIS